VSNRLRVAETSFCRAGRFLKQPAVYHPPLRSLAALRMPINQPTNENIALVTQPTQKFG
jgi:hypothetical protein